MSDAQAAQTDEQTPPPPAEETQPEAARPEAAQPEPSAPPSTAPATPPATTAVPPPAATPAASATTAPPPHAQKNPFAAAFLSIMPGLGHVYNGLYQRAVVFFAMVFGVIAIAADAKEVIFVFAAIFLWFFNLLDSYRQAKLINEGYATDLGLLDKPARQGAGLAALWGGIFLVALGALELLERFDLWDWRYMEDIWPAGLIVAGGWLIYAYLQNRDPD